MKPVRAAIALGANLASPEAQVLRAFDEIARMPETTLVARSSLYRTAPVGYADQPAFINAAALVDTTLSPRALLDGLLAIERAHGRVRDVPNGPRTLDLDVVVYGDTLVDEPGLAIPHPRAHERAFVLAPLSEIAPGLRIPGHGFARECLEKCDRSGIAKMETA
jgi:2-amino-4-hydroxy-6-hydroxymethyldihydropteridine diphosphokinase